MRKIKTKPFNLQKALNGAPVVTRDGREVEIIDYDPQREFGILFQIKGSRCTLTAKTEGFWYVYPTEFDLFLLDEETQEGGEK